MSSQTRRRTSRASEIVTIGLVLLFALGAFAGTARVPDPDPLSAISVPSDHGDKRNKSKRTGCTVNVNIRNSAAVATTTIERAKAELSKIYAEAGVELSFGVSEKGKTSVDLWIVNSYPRYIVKELQDLGYTTDHIEGFQSARYFGRVYVRVGHENGHEHNGYYIGRIAAHETGHRLLTGWESRAYGEGAHAEFGIMSYSGYFFLDAPPDAIPARRDSPPPFSFLPSEAEYLKKCEFPQQSAE